MPEWLRESFSQGPDLPPEVLLVRLAMAFALGGAVACVYFFTHRRDETYQPTFVATLVLLTILIALVTQVIGESVARAFSLVGALSIVRFRTVVQDTRDTAFVIFAVVLGMAIGVGHWQVAILGLGVAGLAAFVVRPQTAATDAQALAQALDWRLTVRVGLGDLGGLGAVPAGLEPVLHKNLDAHQPTGTCTSRQGAALDLTYRARLSPTTTPANLVLQLNQLEGVQHVELQKL